MFSVCKDEPCIFLQKDLLIGLYIDDLIQIGSSTSIEEFKKSIKNYFTMKFNDTVDEFVSIELDWTNDRVIISQHKIINKLLHHLRDEQLINHYYRTPGTPGIGIIKTKENE